LEERADRLNWQKRWHGQPRIHLQFPVTAVTAAAPVTAATAAAPVTAVTPDAPVTAVTPDAPVTAAAAAAHVTAVTAAAPVTAVTPDANDCSSRSWWIPIDRTVTGLRAEQGTRFIHLL
jgi:hypothetical protein